MKKIYIAVGHAKDGGVYFYTFDNENDAGFFVNQIYTMGYAQELPVHDSFDINWTVIPQVITNANDAISDMVEWAKQIHLRTN
jgi:hypothetical protein